MDLAIDLRIALESLFLYEGNNAELGFCLALRTAWYLGAEGYEHTQIFSLGYRPPAPQTILPNDGSIMR